MWEKEIWIAKRKSIETNSDGWQIEIFDKPKKYYLNYQPVSGITSYLQYGEKITDVYRAFVDRAYYQGVINVGDRAYLNDGLISEDELRKLAESDNKYCDNANYVVKSVLPQNYKTKIDFIKR